MGLSGHRRICNISKNKQLGEEKRGGEGKGREERARCGSLKDEGKYEEHGWGIG